MISFLELSVKYLNWCAAHQAHRTHEWYANYIYHFLDHLKDKAQLPAMDMKPYQVEEWIDEQKTWGDNYRRGAVVAINRVYNWGERRGYVTHNPIKTTNKPPAQRSKSYTTPDDFKKMIGLIDPSDPFYDLVVFVWETGVRPREASHIEHRHVDLANRRIMFPKEESKGKRRPRRILLNNKALALVEKWMAKNPDGKVFRNTRNTEWNKFSICNRFWRMKEDVGKKLTCYSMRHGFGTRKLKEKHGHIEIADVMGHVNGNMLATIYSHVDEDEEHLRSVLD